MTACSQWTENPSGAKRRKRQMSIAHAIDRAALQRIQFAMQRPPVVPRDYPTKAAI